MRRQLVYDHCLSSLLSAADRTPLGREGLECFAVSTRRTLASLRAMVSVRWLVLLAWTKRSALAGGDRLPEFDERHSRCYSPSVQSERSGISAGEEEAGDEERGGSIGGEEGQSRPGREGVGRVADREDGLAGVAGQIRAEVTGPRRRQEYRYHRARPGQVQRPRRSHRRCGG